MSDERIANIILWFLLGASFISACAALAHLCPPVLVVAFGWALIVYVFFVTWQWRV